MYQGGVHRVVGMGTRVGRGGGVPRGCRVVGTRRVLVGTGLAWPSGHFTWAWSGLADTVPRPPGCLSGY